MHGNDISRLIEAVQNLMKHDYSNKEACDVLRNYPIRGAELQPYTFFTAEKYTRNLIYKEPGVFEIILFGWLPGQRSSIHSHDGQKCYARVESGILSFTNFEPDETGELKIKNKLEVDAGYIDGPAGIHQIANNSDRPATSVHLYSAPLEQFCSYDKTINRAQMHSQQYYSINGKKQSVSE